MRKLIRKEKKNKVYVGKRLYTKDGRKIGNVRVIRKMKIPMYMSKYIDNLWLLRTDYGNTARMTEQEIRTQFWLYR